MPKRQNASSYYHKKDSSIARGDGGQYEENSAAKVESNLEIDGTEVSVTFDETSEIIDEGLGASETRSGRAASLRGDGVKDGENNADAEGSTVEKIDRKEVSVTFDERNDIFDEEVGASESRGGRAASLRGDGVQCVESSAAEEGSTAEEIDRKEVSVTFDETSDIVDEEVGVYEEDGAAKEMLTAEKN